MEEEKKKKLYTIVSYIICFGIMIVMGVGVAFLKDLWHQTEANEIYMILCDVFTIPGILVMCFWGLVFASNNGVMDGVIYGLKHFFSMLIPGTSAKRDEKFYDYLEERRARRWKGTHVILISGAIFFAIGMIFLVLFLKTEV